MKTSGRALRHERMGYIGDEAFTRLARMINAVNLYETHLEISKCIHCLATRQKAQTHRNPMERGKHSMEFIYIDVKGPINIPGCSVFYWLVIKDDYVKYSEVFPLKTKDEAIAYVIWFIKHNSYKSHRTRRARINNGELKSKAWDDYSLEQGIYTEWTIPGNPQQNGVAENMNLYFKDHVELIMRAAQIPFKHWPMVVITLNYLRNRLPVSDMEKTPYEAFKGSKSNFSHIRTTGFMGYKLERNHRDLPLFKDRARQVQLIRFAGEHTYMVLDQNGNPKEALIQLSEELEAGSNLMDGVVGGLSIPMDEAPGAPRDASGGVWLSLAPTHVSQAS